jgi:hypothetical protein
LWRAPGATCPRGTTQPNHREEGEKRATASGNKIPHRILGCLSCAVGGRASRQAKAILRTEGNLERENHLAGLVKDIYAVKGNMEREDRVADLVKDINVFDGADPV